MTSAPKYKVAWNPEFREVIYSRKRLEILKNLRDEAAKIMMCLKKCGIIPATYGSIARGDVTEGSDIDIVIFEVIPPFRIEFCLEGCGYTLRKRYVVKATPSSTPKGYLELDPEGRKVVTFPLRSLSPREWEFYRFGGLITLKEVGEGRRVSGVNKNLILIVPTSKGHRELPVIGYESLASRVLGISVETVLERVKVLTRRDLHGRTGVFLNYVLAPDETFEDIYRKLRINLE